MLAGCTAFGGGQKVDSLTPRTAVKAAALYGGLRVSLTIACKMDKLSAPTCADLRAVAGTADALLGTAGQAVAEKAARLYGEKMVLCRDGLMIPELCAGMNPEKDIEDLATAAEKQPIGSGLDAAQAGRLLDIAMRLAGAGFDGPAGSAIALAVPELLKLLSPNK